MYYDNVCMTVFVCFITKLMVCILIYSQYPLRPAHLSYDTSGVVGARVKPRQQKMEIDVAIPIHGEHYSRSRGEQMARAVDCASSEPCYKRYFSTTTTSSSSYSSSHLLSSIAHPLSSSPPCVHACLHTQTHTYGVCGCFCCFCAVGCWIVRRWSWTKLHRPHHSLLLLY